MDADSARYGSYVKKAMAKAAAAKKNTLTATDTGARLNAIKNFAKKPGIGAYVKRAAATDTPKGMTPQFRETTSQDIEKMIKGG